MAKARAGLPDTADPLAVQPRLPRVIPHAQYTEDDVPQPQNAPIEPADEDRERAAAPVKSPAVDRSGLTTNGGQPTERPEGSVARKGPASLQAGAAKKSYSFYIDFALLEEARDTVLFLTGDPAGPRNLSALIEEGVRREILRLQDELHGGQEFPHRRVALRTGGNTRNT